MESQLSYLSLHRNVTFMKMLGIYPINKMSSIIKKCFHRFYRFSMISFILLYTFQEIKKIYEERHNGMKMMETVFLFLTYTDYIFKIFVFSYKSDQIEEILDITKGPIFNQGEEKHRAPLLKTIRAGLIFVRWFNLLTVFTCFLWGLQPTIQHLQGKTIELAIWLPFDINVDPNFYFAIFYMIIQTSLLGVGNSTADSFVAYLMEQCKTQMSILRSDLENIVENCQLHLKTEDSREIEDISLFGNLETRLIKIIIHHREIVRMMDKVQDVFGTVIFYQFLVGGWILCTSAYSMVTINPASVEFISMLLYISCILIELFLYCYFGNEVTHESEMIMKSAYESNWLAFPIKHRRILIIFMERLKRPILPLAGSLIPLANSTFVSIGRSSYTFYAFLKNSESGN